VTWELNIKKMDARQRLSNSKVTRINRDIPDLAYAVQSFGSSSDSGEFGGNEHPLKNAIILLWESKWLISACAAFFLLIGLIIVLIKVDEFRTDGLIQVATNQRSVGQAAEFSELFGESTEAESEIALIKSRRILGEVVDYLRLDIAVVPLKPPTIALRMNEFGSLTSGLAHWMFDDPGYSWEQANIEVTTIDLPPRLRVEVVVRDGGRLDVFSEEGDELAVGALGEDIEIADGVLFIGSAQADPGAGFLVWRRPRLAAMDDLNRRIVASPTSDGSGYVRLSLTGGNPQRISEILNRVMDEYLDYRSASRSQESEQILAFLGQQLENLKQRMEASEMRLQAYYEEQSSAEAGQVAEYLPLQRLVEIDRELLDLRIRQQELKGRYSPQHPRYDSLDQSIVDLDAEKRAAIDSIQIEPNTEQELTQLVKNVEDDTNRYNVVLNKVLELTAAEATGDDTSARIIDAAESPVEPINDNKALILAISLVLGLGVGVAIAQVMRYFRSGLSDPEEIERVANLPVIATIPSSPKQRQINRRVRKSEIEGLPVLSTQFPDEIAVEGLRGLRTFIQQVEVSRSPASVLITSPTISSGKSFVSVNLAVLMANLGIKTLLVEGDLRRGELSRVFSLEGRAGMTDMLTGEIKPKKRKKKVVHRAKEISDLYVMPKGSPCARPSELLASGLSDSFLDLFEDFDRVIIDSPPLLAIADPLVLTKVAQTAFVVVRAGSNSPRELKNTLVRLRRTAIPVAGIVLNDLKPTTSLTGDGRYYGYAYQYGSAGDE